MRTGTVLPAAAGIAGVGAALVYRGLLSGALAPDLNVGRRTRPLGPIEVVVGAPREIVFDVIAGPYLGRTPRALAGSLQVLERGADLVLAAHYTPLRGGGRATTVETVRFSRPSHVDFRLVRGPVPYVVETFALTAVDATTTRLAYTGELGTDLGRLGQWWGDRVTPVWEAAVAHTFRSVAAEAERRTGARGRVTRASSRGTVRSSPRRIRRMRAARKMIFTFPLSIHPNFGETDRPAWGWAEEIARADSDTAQRQSQIIRKGMSGRSSAKEKTEPLRGG